MESAERSDLRVLAASQTGENLEEIARLVIQIGHAVVARSIEIEEVASVAAEERPDVALVALREEDTAHTLDLISEITHGAICPVIALLPEERAEFVAQAAERGIFAYASPVGPEELRGAIEVALSRFGQYERLEGAMGRNGAIECAKGILMERYFMDEQHAFELLRRQARNSGLKVVDAAEIVMQGHRLLPKKP